MAKNSQTFKAVAKLEASQFKKEARNISRVVNNMRNTFLGFAASLGAGLGLGQLISSMRKTSVELSTAMATLENVSNETRKYVVGTQEASLTTNNFGQTLAFVERMANTYKQDLISLTNGYAQFKAASDQAGVSMEDQEKIYEALTRAAAFFHMSGDRTRDMMNAVIQMMSKGKVASEELRRQLGNSLPGAFGLMAVAAQKAGIATTGTVAELEDLMRKSKVLSAQVLPAFADELNKITKDINLDSLQLTINELKNAWTNLTRETNMEGFYKGILDETTKAVNYITNNLRQVKATIIGLFTSITSFKLFNGLKAQGDEWLKNQQRNLKTMKSDYSKAFKELAALEKKYPNLVQVKGSMSGTGKNAPSVQYRPGHAGLSNKEVKEINQQLSQVVGKWDNVQKQTELVGKNYNAIQLAGKGILNIIKNIGATIASMGIVALASAILGYITKIVSNAIQFKKELREIDNIGKDFGDGTKAAEANISAQRAQANALLKVIKETKENDENRVSAIKQLNELQGDIKGYAIDTKDTYDEIVTKTNGWLTELKKVAQVQVTLNRLQDNTTKLQDLEIQRELKQQEIRKHQHAAGRDNYGNTVWEDNAFEGNKERKRQLALIDAEIAQRKKLGDQLSANLDVQQKDLIVTKNQNDTDDDDNKNKNKKKTTLEQLTEALDDYDKELKKLDNQFKNGAITQDEYDKGTRKLAQDTFKEVAGFENLEQLIKKVKNGEERLASLSEANTEADIWAEIEAEIEKVNKQFEEYLDNQTKLQDEQLGNWLGYKRPKEGTRDSFFDYKKSKSDIMGEALEVKKTYQDQLKDAIKVAEAAAKAGISGAQKELDTLRKMLIQAIHESDDLETKMKLAERAEDLAKLQDQFNKKLASGIKSVATSFDRVGDGIKKIKEAFGEDVDTEAWENWEKFTAILNEVVQMVDLVASAYKWFTALSKIQEGIEAAENAKLVEKNGLLATELGLLKAINEEKAKGVIETEAQTGANIAEAASSTAAASANAGEAVAGATASGAKLPFPYNLIAIAAGIAAVITALATMSKYATGGFVDGKFQHGDKNLIRANAGELVLNPTQQRNILALANGKAGGLGGEVTFKLRGTELIGAIENTQSRKRG